MHKIAIIGCGRMGRRHIKNVQELGLVVAGVSDISTESLAMAGEESRIPEDCRFQDTAQLLEETRPDAVIIATTASTHAEYVCQAAEAGTRLLLCEKPMAVSIGQCEKMIEVCQRNGAQLAVNHQMRFMDQYIKAKRIMESEVMGGLRSVTVLGGNFGLAMNGCHYFEMFRYLTNEEPVEVTAWFSDGKVSNPRGEQFEDRAGSVRLVTGSGKRFFLDASADQGHGMRVIYCGRYGQLVVDELAGVMTLSARLEEYRSLPSTRYGMPWLDETHRIVPVDALTPSRAVLNALLKDAGVPSGEDGRLAVSILVASYLSHEAGNRCIQINRESLPEDLVFPWA